MSASINEVLLKHCYPHSFKWLLLSYNGTVEWLQQRSCDLKILSYLLSDPVQTSDSFPVSWRLSVKPKHQILHWASKGRLWGRPSIRIWFGFEGYQTLRILFRFFMWLHMYNSHIFQKFYLYSKVLLLRMNSAWETSERYV